MCCESRTLHSSPLFLKQWMDGYRRRTSVCDEMDIGGPERAKKKKDYSGYKDHDGLQVAKEERTWQSSETPFVEMIRQSRE